jgi:hypothetical protein
VAVAEGPRYCAAPKLPSRRRRRRAPLVPAFPGRFGLRWPLLGPPPLGVSASVSAGVSAGASASVSAAAGPHGIEDGEPEVAGQDRRQQMHPHLLHTVGSMVVRRTSPLMLVIGFRKRIGGGYEKTTTTAEKYTFRCRKLKMKQK